MSTIQLRTFRPLLTTVLALSLGAPADALARKDKRSSRRQKRSKAAAAHTDGTDDAGPASPAPAGPPETAAPPASAGDVSSLLQVARPPPVTDPSRVRVAVMDLSASETIPKQLVASLVSVIPQELERIGAFSAIASQDVARILQYQVTQQQLGCDEPECLSELGDVLGAEYLVNGSLTLADTQYVLQLQLTDVKASRVQTRVKRDYVGESKGLYEEVRAGTKQLVRDVLAERSGLLHLVVSEEGASVKVDDTVVGISPVPMMSVPGGLRSVAVEKEGFVAFRTDVNIRQSDAAIVNAVLVPSADFADAYQARASLLRTLSWTSLGVGGAALAASVGLFVTAKSRMNELDKDLSIFNSAVDRSSRDYEELGDREKGVATLEALGLTAVTVGVVGVAAGLLMRSLGPDPDRYHVTTVEVAHRDGGGGGGWGAFVASLELWLGPRRAGLVGAF
jgi:TolB-like protein